MPFVILNFFERLGHRRAEIDAPAQTLSIGQQQRLRLARSLATDPEILLMDEPTSALDPDTTAVIAQLIRRLSIRRSLILITHDPHPSRARLRPNDAAESHKKTNNTPGKAHG